MNVFSKLLFCVVFLFSGAVASAQNVHGVLRVVKGDVQIKSAKSGQAGRARLGAQVFPKDIVITGKDSRAKIVMVDNNEINVSPESQIEIQHYEFDPAQGKKDVLLNVIYGKVRSKVEQKYDGKTSKFQVKTPSAVAGVRGTDFMASYNRMDNTSSVVTFHGAVEFGLPGPGGTIANAVSVTPGKMASSMAGGAPSIPANVPKEQLAQMDNDTKADSLGAGGTAGAKSERQPAANGEKKDEGGAKKDDGAAKSDGAKKGADGGGNSRGPASVGGGVGAGGGTGPGPGPGPSMLDVSKDLPQGKEVFVDPTSNLRPQIPVMNTIPTVTQPTECTNCKNLLQDGKTNLQINVTH